MEIYDYTISYFVIHGKRYLHCVHFITTHIARKVKKNHFFVSEKKSLKLIKISDFLLPI